MESYVVVYQVKKSVKQTVSEQLCVLKLQWKKTFDPIRYLKPFPLPKQTHIDEVKKWKDDVNTTL